MAQVFSLSFCHIDNFPTTPHRPTFGLMQNSFVSFSDLFCLISCNKFRSVRENQKQKPGYIMLYDRCICQHWLDCWMQRQPFALSHTTSTCNAVVHWTSNVFSVFVAACAAASEIVKRWTWNNRMNEQLFGDFDSFDVDISYFEAKFLVHILREILEFIDCSSIDFTSTLDLNIKLNFLLSLMFKLSQNNHFWYKFELIHVKWSKTIIRKSRKLHLLHHQTVRSYVLHIRISKYRVFWIQMQSTKG